MGAFAKELAAGVTLAISSVPKSRIEPTGICLGCILTSLGPLLDPPNSRASARLESHSSGRDFLLAVRASD